MGCESTQHEDDHREFDEIDSDCDEGLVVFVEAPVATEPGEGALDDPASWQDGDAALNRWPSNDLDCDGLGARKRRGERRPGIADSAKTCRSQG